MAYFDVKAARESGATDSDIADYLGETYGVDVNKARANGISDKALASELLKLDKRTYQNDMQAKANIAKGPQAPDVSKMSGLKRFQLGVGSGLTDLAMGARDLVGAATDREVMAKREADKPLTGDGNYAGMAGNITGKVLPTLAVPFGAAANLVSKPVQAAGMAINSGRAVNLGTALASGGVPTAIVDSAIMGGALGGLEATAGDESRGQNVAVGSALGSALPIIGATVKGVGGLVAPFTKSGQERIAADALTGMASNPRAVVQGLAGYKPAVPGVTQTTAAVTGDLGLASAERTARGLMPTDFAAQDIANNAARVSALRGIAQTPDDVVAAEAARRAAAVPMLRQASAAAQGPVDNKPILESIDKVLAGPARKRDAAVNALSWVREKIDDPNLSFDDLYAIRQDIGDAMAGRLSNDKIKGIQYARKEVNAIKRSIDQTLNKMSGGKFGEYNRTWAGMSRPIEQMKAGQEIMAKGEARAMDIRGNPVIKPQDIRGYMVKKGEGKFGPVFSDEQQGVLSALAGDIERSNIVDAVRPRGSDTFQNLAQNEALKRAMGGSAPVALQEAMRKTLGWLYTGPDEAIQGVLINALRDPAEAARLLSMAPDEATRSTIRKALAEYSRQAAQRVPLGIPAAAVNSD